MLLNGLLGEEIRRHKYWVFDWSVSTGTRYDIMILPLWTSQSVGQRNTVRVNQDPAPNLALQDMCVVFRARPSCMEKKSKSKSTFFQLVHSASRPSLSPSDAKASVTCGSAIPKEPAMT